MEKIPSIDKNILSKNEQINPTTGVSVDYFNQYSFLIQLYKNGGIDNLKDEIKKLRKDGVDITIHSYSDAYKDYEVDINEESKKNIFEIDELSNLLNQMIQDIDHIDEEDFCEICNRLNFLLYGREDNHRDLRVKKFAQAA